MFKSCWYFRSVISAWVIRLVVDYIFPPYLSPMVCFYAFNHHSGSCGVCRLSFRPSVSSSSLFLYGSCRSLSTGLFFQRSGAWPYHPTTLPLGFALMVCQSWCCRSSAYTNHQSLAMLGTIAFNQFVNLWALVNGAINWWYYIVYCVWLVFELVFICFFIVTTKCKESALLKCFWIIRWYLFRCIHVVHPRVIPKLGIRLSSYLYVSSKSDVIKCSNIYMFCGDCLISA